MTNDGLNATSKGLKFILGFESSLALSKQDYCPADVLIHEKLADRSSTRAAKFFVASPSAPSLQNLLGLAIFSGGRAVIIEGGVARRSAMVTDLQVKAEKYESKAAQCEESARQAPDEPERAFYEVLAGYYGELATDFRQVIAKRNSG